MRGRAEIAAFVKVLQTGFPDMRFSEPEPPILASSVRALGVWEMTATFTGPLDPPGFAPTGAAIQARGIDEWHFKGTLVCKYQAFFDSYAVARMIGAAPAVDSRLERFGAMAQRVATRLRRRR